MDSACLVMVGGERMIAARESCVDPCVDPDGVFASPAQRPAMDSPSV